jgi:hypothetical protein
MEAPQRSRDTLSSELEDPELKRSSMSSDPEKQEDVVAQPDPTSNPNALASEFGPPPDGGWEAWLVVLGGACTVFSSFGWINCMRSLWYRSSS